MNFAPTSYNLQIHALGTQISGHAIAFDLDGTLLDEIPPEPGAASARFEMKAGAESLLRGLAEGNSLLLYTGRDTASTAAILRARPALRRAFMPELEEGETLSEERLLDAPGVFSRGDWKRLVEGILGKMQGARTLFESIIALCWGSEALRRVLIPHFKLPELARLRGKRDFEVLVDNSPDVKRILGHFGFPVSMVQIPDYRILRAGESLRDYGDDVLLRGAQILAGDAIWGAERRVVRVEQVRRLKGEPVERFEVEL